MYPCPGSLELAGELPAASSKAEMTGCCGFGLISECRTKDSESRQFLRNLAAR